MKKIRVAINGMGRIGRAFYKIASQIPEIELVAVNDLGGKDNIEYLLSHDSVYGKWGGKLEAQFFQEKDPGKLPWKDLNIDVVVESTGFFTEFEKAKAHIAAGAKRVVITAPGKGEGATVLMGVNDDALKTCQVSSNASCTTNAASPLIAILDEALGIEKAVLNTAHAMTNSQPAVDSPNAKNFREGRAASQNIVPNTTGAAVSVTEAFAKLKGLFDGIAMRVPVIAGSLVDVTFISKRATSAEEVNQILRKAAADERWKKVFAVSEDDLVSSDIIGSQFGSIADLKLTRVVGGNLVKVLAWYDNEMGYAYTLAEHVIKAGQQ